MKLKVISFLIYFTLILLSCNQKNSSPELEKHFTESQIEDLNIIRLFYINSVLEIKTSEFKTNYLKAFDKKSANSFESISKQKIDSIFNMISETTMNEIWDRKNDTIFTSDNGLIIYKGFKPNFNGKYQAYLNEIAKTNEAIKDYYEHMSLRGDFRQQWFYTYTLDYPKEFDLNNIDIQTIIAINHISNLKDLKSQNFKN